jgi:hypothetical protein
LLHDWLNWRFLAPRELCGLRDGDSRVTLDAIKVTFIVVVVTVNVCRGCRPTCRNFVAVNVWAWSFYTCRDNDGIRDSIDAR